LGSCIKGRALTENRELRRIFGPKRKLNDRRADKTA
jgi:hypothetical protein